MKSLIGKLHRSWQSYIKKLTEANRKNFGGGPPDCCGVNRDKKIKVNKTGTKNG